MSNYTKTTDFAAKDTLPTGDSGKIVRGSEFGTEFDNIAVAVNSKSDSFNPVFTGEVKLGDTVRLQLGDDADLEIFSNGAGGTVENDTGNLTIKNRAVDGDIYFQSDDGTGVGTDTYFLLDGGEKKTKFLEDVLISGDLETTGAVTTANLTATGVVDFSGASSVLGGVPAGGSTGQILAKNSNTDYDVGFVDPADVATLAATNVTVADAGGYYTATDVEGVLQEIGAHPAGFDPNTDSFNIGSDAVSSGTDSIALGHDASATAARDIALGLDAVASGGGSIAIGQETDSTGVRSIAIGKGAQSTLSTSIAIGEDASTLNGAGGGPIAIGYSALSTGISGISLGPNTTASGNQSVSIGDSASATGGGSTAIGQNASVTGGLSTALGYGATVTATTAAIAINDATASGIGSMAIHDNALSSGSYSMAIGYWSQATGSSATAVGYSSEATAESSTALGHGAQANAVDSIAIGRLADAGYSNTISIGANSAAGNLGSTVIGYSASSDVNNINGVAIGYDATANQIASVAIGNNATSNSQFGTALGRDSNADSGSYGTALGYSSEAATYATAVGGNTDATGHNSTAVGYGSNASSNGTVALGNSAQALNLQAISIGQNASSGGSNNIAIGNAPTTTGVSSIAIGTSANSSGGTSISIGADSEATVAGSIAVGKSASATGLGVPIAIGRDTESSGAYGISMGEGAIASGAQTLAIGYGAEANNDNGIAIGRQLTVAGQKAIGIGWGAVAGSYDSIGIGTFANAPNTYSISIGAASQALGSGGVAIGGGAITSVTNAHGVAIGYAAQANDVGGIAIGNNAIVSNTGTFGTAIGRDSLADNGPYGTALGYSSTAYFYATALGSNTDATGNYSTAIGYGADSLGEDAIALGHFAGADADNTIHINASGVNTNQPQTAGYIVIETDDASLTYDGTWSLAGGALSTDGLDVTGDVTFGDNDKAIFGAGNDLQIYHDGSHNFIEGANAGNIYIRNQLDDGDIIIQSDDGLGGMANYVQADGSNGEVRLFHYGSEKLNTTSTGIDVTGTAVADGLTVQTSQGDITIPTNTSSLNFDRAGTSYLRATDATGNFSVITGADNFTTKRMDVLANGDIRFYEDTGTTPKFHWDASAESLAIGTTSPVEALSVAGDAIFTNDTAVTFGYRGTSGSTDLVFRDRYIGSDRMRITSTGIDVTGTATMDGLDVRNTSSPARIKVQRDDNTNSVDSASIDLLEGTGINADFGVLGSFGYRLEVDGSTNKFNIKSGNGASVANRLSVERDTGDISFYEDTGTTAKFHWDASAEALGIGTDSPASALEISDSGVELRITDSRNGSFTTGDTVSSLGFYSDDTSGGSGGNTGLARGVIDVVSENAFGSSHAMAFKTRGDVTTAAAEAMRITSSGLVGLGTSVPTNPLTVSSSGSASYTSSKGIVADYTGSSVTEVVPIGFSWSSSTATQNPYWGMGLVPQNFSAGNADLGFYTTGTERLRIASDGSVNITNASSATFSIQGGDGNSKNIVFKKTTGGAQQAKIQAVGDDLRFITGSGTDEAFRIDSSQNLLVGKTAVDIATVGTQIEAAGAIAVTRDGSTPLYLNRKTSDGTIIDFRKDGTTVGAIGTVSGDLAIFSSEANHKGLRFGAGFVAPTTNSTTVQDATTDLGVSTARFRNLYLSGGVSFDDNPTAVTGNVSSKTLDDYEEGTWTPDVVGSSTAGSYSNISRAGTYTKVGNVVTVWMLFYGESGTGTGNLTITGLPFVALSNRSGISVLQYNSGLDMPTGYNTPCVMTNANATSAQVRCNSDSTGSYAAMGYPTTAGYLRFTLTYETTA